MTIQINEPGLYRLIFSSKLTFAERFKEWVLHDVLPSIRKTGGYTIHNQLSIMNELDLHSNIVKYMYMREYHPNNAKLIIPGLGELQDTKGIGE